MRRVIKCLILSILLILLTSCSFFGKDIDFLPMQKEEGNEIELTELKDNSITVGLVSVDTFNPFKTTSVTVRDMLGFIYEPLFSINPDLTTTGVLAHSYEQSHNGMSLKINLKNGVKWHDGTEFTANDVVYTINEIKKTPCRYSKLCDLITSASIINSYALNIEFSRPMSNLPALLSFPVIKSGSGETTDLKPVGTGPFAYDNDNDTLTAFNKYHGSKAKIDSIKIKRIKDNEKFTSLFSASVLDAASYEMLKGQSYVPKSNAKTYECISNNMVYVGFNNASTVFKYDEARRSVSKLIDRRNIVTHIYFSKAVEAMYPCNPQSRFYPEGAVSLRSDITGAQADLDNNGWEMDKSGIFNRRDALSVTYFTVNLLVNADNENRVLAAEKISSVMADAGMKCNVIKCSPSEFSARINAGNYDMFIGESELLPNNDLTELLYSSGNIFNYSNNDVDNMLSQLGTLTSEEDVKKAWAKLYETLIEECPIAPICFTKNEVVTSARVKSGVAPSVEGTFRETENWSLE